VGGRGGGPSRPALDAARIVSAADAFETLLARALIAGVRAVPWRASLGIGARLGDAAAMLGIRRRVGEENLARAFPERSASERARILREHYRELGRVAAEYPRLAELAFPGRVSTRFATRARRWCSATASTRHKYSSGSVTTRPRSRAPSMCT